ncbi:MAG: M67 family metallopeptidase [Candidatus Bathyarchaeia archaeon]
MKIRRGDLEAILRHARESHPFEACGLLLGRRAGSDRIVEEARPARNLMKSPFEYRIDPEDLLKAFEEAERRGLEIIGSYHSHPLCEPSWSQIDEERGEFWVGYSFLIISPSGRFISYVKEERGVREEKVEIF